jgi:HAD superfamily hydrolase (TIGR01509 family)
MDVFSGMPELIIYDCDGTLVDSERLVAEVCLAAIHDLGLSHWTMDRYVHEFVGMPGEVGWSAVWRELGRPVPPEFNGDIDGRIFARFEERLELLPGVRAAVEDLDMPRCVASSTRRDHLVERIARMGLDDLFNGNVFSASQVKRAKPAPDVFLFSASQMGHDPKDCVVIEDSVPGVTGARRAGMRVIGFTGAAHDPAAMRARLAEAGAAHVAHHMVELPALVRAL